MNYLAHLYLSQDNGLSMAGNLMADFLKHVELSELPAAVLNGIENHRLADHRLLFQDERIGQMAIRAWPCASR